MSNGAEDDDGLGPDLLDRGSGKIMGGGSGGGHYDESYEDALRILGRTNEIPSPFIQTARIMTNADAAELARRITDLRRIAAVGVDRLLSGFTLGAADTAPSVGETVQSFIAALQEVPADQDKLATLIQEIGRAGGEVQQALEQVCQHSEVQAKLTGKGLSGME